MNLAVDYGNTRIKTGTFKQSDLKEVQSFDEESKFIKWLEGKNFENTIVSSVTRPASEIVNEINSSGEKLVMDHSLPVPITIKYKTPATLGLDRIAAACGAIDKKPDQHCLVIDMGSCINYEFVDNKKNYYGGAISPGLSMRFKAMHNFTARLPLAEPSSDVPLIGSTTIECMQSGVMNGMLAEIEGIIDRYMKKYPTMGVILCGGDAHIFEKKLKQPIFVAPNLVLSGLNRILLHNVKI